jgi:hypothetical protein
VSLSSALHPAVNTHTATTVPAIPGFFRMSSLSAPSPRACSGKEARI